MYNKTVTRPVSFSRFVYIRVAKKRTREQLKGPREGRKGRGWGGEESRRRGRGRGSGKGEVEGGKRRVKTGGEGEGRLKLNGKKGGGGKR